MQTLNAHVQSCSLMLDITQRTRAAEKIRIINFFFSTTSSVLPILSEPGATRVYGRRPPVNEPHYRTDYWISLSTSFPYYLCNSSSCLLLFIRVFISSSRPPVFVRTHTVVSVQPGVYNLCILPFNAQRALRILYRNFSEAKPGSSKYPEAEWACRRVRLLSLRVHSTFTFDELAVWNVSFVIQKKYL
jgi:hypothetical protein